eukprot:scaffold9653_cov55-Phaeocystis_antarctica.AAC.2
MRATPRSAAQRANAAASATRRAQRRGSASDSTRCVAIPPVNYDPALIAPEPKPDFVRLMHAPRRPRTAVKPPPTPASDPQPEHRTQLWRRRRRRRRRSAIPRAPSRSARCVAIPPVNYDPALIAPEPKPDFVHLMHAPRRPRTAVKPPPTPASGLTRNPNTVPSCGDRGGGDGGFPR